MFQVQVDFLDNGEIVLVDSVVTEENYSGKYLRLMEDYSIDLLIINFIKECKKKAKATEKEIESFNLENELAGTKILFKIGRDSKMLGNMVWAFSPKLGRAILMITRDDRNGNMYFYNSDGQLVSRKDC